MRVKIPTEVEGFELELDLKQKFVQRKFFFDVLKRILLNSYSSEYLKALQEKRILGEENFEFIQKRMDYIISIYEENKNIIKAAKNLHPDDVRYFDFYEIEDLEGLKDKINQYKIYQQAKKMGDKLLTNYASLMYVEKEGVRVLDEKVATALLNTYQYIYEEGDLNKKREEEVSNSLNSIKKFDKEQLLIALKKAASNRHNVEWFQQKIKEKNLNAEIIYNENYENDFCFAVRVDDFEASEALGHSNFCICNEEHYWETYGYTNDLMIKQNPQVFVFISKVDVETGENMVVELGITFNGENRNLECAFEVVNNEPLSEDEVERILGFDNYAEIREIVLNNYSPLQAIKNGDNQRIKDYIEYSNDEAQVLLDGDIGRCPTLVKMYLDTALVSDNFNYLIREDFNNTIYDLNKLPSGITNGEIINMLNTLWQGIKSGKYEVSPEEFADSMAQEDYEYIEELEEEIEEQITYKDLVSSDTGKFYKLLKVENKDDPEIGFLGSLFKEEAERVKLIENLGINDFGYRGNRFNFNPNKNCSMYVLFAVEHYKMFLDTKVSQKDKSKLVNNIVRYAEHKLEEEVIDEFLNCLKSDFKDNSMLDLNALILFLSEAENKENAVSIIKKLPQDYLDYTTLNSRSLLELKDNPELLDLFPREKIKSSVELEIKTKGFNSDIVKRYNKEKSVYGSAYDGYKLGSFKEFLTFYADKHDIDLELIRGLSSGLTFGDKDGLNEYIEEKEGLLKRKRAAFKK